MPHPARPRQMAGLALLAALTFGGPLPAQETPAEPEPAEAALPFDGDAGAFLAARLALSRSDFAAAADWYARALVSDPKNPRLLDGAIAAHIGLGEFGPAASMADVARAEEAESALGYLARLVRAMEAGNWQEVIESSAPGVDKGAILDGLVTAWAEVGLGRMSEATVLFDKLAAQKGTEVFALYHKALALASAGDFDGADAIFSGKAAEQLKSMRRGILAHVRVLSQLERNADALKLIDEAFVGELDPELQQLKHRLTAGEPLPFDLVGGARDGMAEVFYTMAMALSQDGDGAQALIYARGAEALRPSDMSAVLLVAGLLEDQGQHELAIEVYGKVPADAPVFHVAEIGRAEATYAAGRKEAAIEILLGLTRARPDLLISHIALADAYRRDERFDEARRAYDAAIALLPKPEAENWSLFFSRGICAERLGDFEGQVADMREALRLNPDQPQVLNYLGYSYVDRGENLDEALSMIERAVAASPGSGYIIDSLAWAYYRLGRFEEAVEPMERASLLEPVDPIVTDHLGDVYWAVGRTREAEFQWHRALSYGPEEKDAARIRAKLEKGLDAVLADEGAQPLNAVATGN